jgi:hypothetical protein
MSQHKMNTQTLDNKLNLKKMVIKICLLSFIFIEVNWANGLHKMQIKVHGHITEQISKQVSYIYV